jgi:hypothetical protein
MRKAATLAVCGTLLLSACANGIPSIARGLPRAFGPTSEFDARIRQRFPVGSPEGNLVAELRAEKFTIVEVHDPAEQYRHNAYYEHHAFPCRETWTIKWTADDGHIIGIEGRGSGDLCL